MDLIVECMDKLPQNACERIFQSCPVEWMRAVVPWNVELPGRHGKQLATVDIGEQWILRSFFADNTLFLYETHGREFDCDTSVCLAWFVCNELHVSPDIIDTDTDTMWKVLSTMVQAIIKWDMGSVQDIVVQDTVKDQSLASIVCDAAACKRWVADGVRRRRRLRGWKVRD